jgi:hypothetical protein
MQIPTRSKPRRGLTIGLVVAIAALGAAPAQAANDRNHDKIPDRWERKHDLSLKRDQAKRDQDRDGLKNLGEFEAGLDPRDGDTDDDGTEDGDEGAGTIASFDADTGALTIDLFNRGELTGTVTEDTEIRCEDEGDGEESNCRVGDLVPDTVVSEAEIEVDGQGAIFKEVELR